MNRDFCTMYQDALAKAFIVLTPQGKRLAVFPYGAGEDDMPEKQARKHAWLFLNRTNGQDGIEPERRVCVCGNCHHRAIDAYCPEIHAYVHDENHPACGKYQKIETNEN